MKAIFVTGGKQYYVTEGDTIYVELLNAEVGSTIKFDEVLFVDGVAGIIVRMCDFFEHPVRHVAVHRFLPLSVDRRIVADAAGMVAHEWMDFRNGGHAAGYAVFLCHCPCQSMTDGPGGDGRVQSSQVDNPCFHAGHALGGQFLF